MFTSVRQLWTTLCKCDAGVTLVEYGVALTVVIFMGAAAFAPLVAAIEGNMASVMPPQSDSVG